MDQVVDRLLDQRHIADHPHRSRGRGVIQFDRRGLGDAPVSDAHSFDESGEIDGMFLMKGHIGFETCDRFEIGEERRDVLGFLGDRGHGLGRGGLVRRVAQTAHVAQEHGERQGKHSNPGAERGKRRALFGEQQLDFAKN